MLNRALADLLSPCDTQHRIRSSVNVHAYRAHIHAVDEGLTRCAEAAYGMMNDVFSDSPT